MKIFKRTLTKSKLLDGDTAYWLAKRADQAFADSEFAQDIDIVGQREGEVAIFLAMSSDSTGWTTDNDAILDMWGGEVRQRLKLTEMANSGVYKREDLLELDGRLAVILAKRADQVFADSEFAQDYDILRLNHGYPAYYLAKNSDKTGWLTYDIRILRLHWVAYGLYINREALGWRPLGYEVQKRVDTHLAILNDLKHRGLYD